MSGQTQGGGIGFVGLLTIVFIVLKLTGVIGWSWWWVLSPSLIAAALWLSAFCLAVCIVARGEWK